MLMTGNSNSPFDATAFLEHVGLDRTIIGLRRAQTFFTQGIGQIPFSTFRVAGQNLLSFRTKAKRPLSLSSLPANSLERSLWRRCLDCACLRPRP